MRLRRNRQRSKALDTSSGNDIANDSGNNLPVQADRLERAVMVMAVHAQQLNNRLERVERDLSAQDSVLELKIDLVDRVEEINLTMATQSDLIDMQVRTAKLANELARVSSELRNEIAKLHSAIPVGSPARQTIYLDRIASELEGLSAIADNTLPVGLFD